MPPQPNRSPARLLAPIALVVVAIVSFVIVLGSGGDSDPGTKAKTATDRTATQTAAQRTVKRTYVVKTGDTLGGIAVKTGITVERLQVLNPEVDPQALVTGQKLKLRQ
jgi:LysM repeat protein